MELYTPRLMIRSFSGSDVAAYAALAADPEVMRYLGSAMDAAAAEAYVLDCIARDLDTGISRYAVLGKADLRFYGFCGFKALTEDYGGQVYDGEPWIDFGWRYRRSVWRQGFGYEAARAVYEYGKSALGLHSIEARAHRDNRGSLRIIEKLGFAFLNEYETDVGGFRRYREVA